MHSNLLGLGSVAYGRVVEVMKLVNTYLHSDRCTAATLEIFLADGTTVVTQEQLIV